MNAHANVLLSCVLCCGISSTAIGAGVQTVSPVDESDTPELIRMLGDAGVANPENIADYVHLLPRNTFSATTNARGETEITAYAADGRSYTVSAIRLLNQSDGTIAFQADVDGWSVEGLLSPHAANQVALEFQFQVPLDIYKAPPVTTIIEFGPVYNWLPTPIGDSTTKASTEIEVHLQTTDCICSYGGGPDASCTAKECKREDPCGDMGTCKDVPSPGSISILGFALPALLMFIGVTLRADKRCQ